MVDRKINYGDLFDFADTAELDKALQSIEKLNANYTRMAETIRTAFGESKTAIRQMASECSSSLQQLNATQEQNRQGILKYAEASEKLVTAQKNLTKSEQALTSAEQMLLQQSDRLDDVFNDNYRAVQNLQTSIAALERENKKLREEMGGDKAVVEQNSDAIHANSMEIELMTQKLKEAQKQMDASAQTVASSSGSYKQMQSALTRLENEYKNMTRAERENTSAGKSTLQQIQILKDALKQMNTELNNGGRSSVTFRTQLMQLTNALKEMASQGLQNTQAYRDMAKEAANMQRITASVNAEIKGMAQNSTIFTGLTQAVSGVAGAYSAMQGIMALTGSKNEDLRLTMVKLQAALAITNGLTAVNTMLQRTSAVNTALLAIKRNILTLATLRGTAATEGNTRATLAQVIAQKALNAVMKMSPAGWLFLILAGLATAYMFLTKAANSTREAMKKSLAVERAQVENNEKLISYIDRESQAELKRAENGVKSAELDKKALWARQDAEMKLALLRQDNADKQANLVRKDINNLDILTAKSRSAQAAVKKMQEYLSGDKAARAKFINPYVFVPDATRDNVGPKGMQIDEKALELAIETNTVLDKRIDIAQKAKDAQEQSGNAIYELQMKHLDELQKASNTNATAGAEYRIAAARHSYEAETAALKEQARLRRDISLQEENLSANQKKAINIKYISEIEEIQRKHDLEKLQREKSLLETELIRAEEGTEAELAAKIRATEKEYEIRKRGAQDNAEEIERLEAESAEAIDKIKRDFAQRREEFELNLKISYINAQLETVIAGSEEEYKLKKELIEKQNELEKTGIKYTEQNLKNREALIKAANARELAAKKKLEKEKAAAEIRFKAQQSVNANEKQIAQNELTMATNGEGHKDNWKLKQENDKLELNSIDVQKEANQKLWDDQLIAEEEYLNTRHSMEVAAIRKSIDMTKEAEAERRALIQATLEVMLEAFSFGAEIIKDASNRELDTLTANMEREQEEYEDNKAAQEAIERKYGARIKVEKRKQAIIDKELAVFEATVKAYQAYNMTLATTPAPANKVLAGIMLGLGLAQAAYIAAKPIPEFWRGSQNTPKGLAKVFERGGELIEYKGQRYYGDKPAIVDLPQGAKVYPNWHEKTREFERLSQVTDLKNFYLNNATEITGKQEVISLESRKLDERAISAAVSKAIRGIPVFQTVFDERGVTTYIGRVASCQNLQRERIRTGGKG